MESLTRTTSTTIARATEAHPEINSLKQPIWASSKAEHFNSSTDFDYDSDTESTKSFFSACSSPTSKSNVEICSPLSSIFDDDDCTLCDVSTEPECNPQPPTTPCPQSTSAPTTSSKSSLETSDSTSLRTQKSTPDSQTISSTLISPSLAFTSRFLPHTESRPRIWETPRKGSCLQCILHGLRCSFAPNPFVAYRFPPRYTSSSSASCARCLRNGEDFCIRKGLRGGEDCEEDWGAVGDESGEGDGLDYWAVGIENQVVGQKVEELQERERGKVRFALPKAPHGSRYVLRRTFGVVEDDWV